jgi:hypothetical protein
MRYLKERRIDAVKCDMCDNALNSTGYCACEVVDCILSNWLGNYLRS